MLATRTACGATPQRSPRSGGGAREVVDVGQIARAFQTSGAKRPLAGNAKGGIPRPWLGVRQVSVTFQTKSDH